MIRLPRALALPLTGTLLVAGIVTVSLHAAHAAALEGFSAALESDATVVIPSDQANARITIRVRNDGTQSWIREGLALEAVNLGTWAKENAPSRLYEASTWHSNNRITLQEQVVAPGEAGTFIVGIVTPVPAPVTQQLRLVREHVGWFGPIITIKTEGVAANPGDPAFVGPAGAAKRVEVNLGTNELTMLEGDVPIATYKISPGKWSTPTPTGTFKIYGKTPTAYSKSYKLYMPYWNAFTANGAYGIHGLPYWKTRRGIVVEGAAHIGKNVSHGCIRLGPGDAEAFFAWADSGTPVKIFR